jgi:uncharacterized membrane protein HdeD (DUF308 family)
MHASAEQDAVFGEIKKNWGWMLALGIVMVILGTIGLGMSTALTLLIAWSQIALALAA